MTQFQLLLSEPHDEVLVFGMSGELDLGTIRPLQEAADRACGTDYRSLVFDLTRLEFIDSSGLRVLVAAHRAMEAKGRASVVVCDSPAMLRVFDVTGLNNVLTIVATRGDALSTYAAAG